MLAGKTYEAGDVPQLSLRTTLVVVPTNLIAQWIEELRKHTQPGTLKW